MFSPRNARGGIIGKLGNDQYVKLLLHGDGADGSQAILDTPSKWRAAKAVSVAGTVQIDTAQSVFGGSSIYFPGTAGNYIGLAHSADWYFNGDWTVDGRIRMEALPASGGYYCLMVDITDATTYWGLFIKNNAGSIELQYQAYYNSTQILFMNRTWGALSANTWYHFAITRAGDYHYMFGDGSQLGTSYYATNRPADNTGSLLIGIYSDGSSFPFKGWKDELRISKGIARWTSGFTPQPMPYL